MRNTFVTLQRADGTLVKRHIPVQVDPMSDREAVEFKTRYGFEGRDIWKIKTISWNPTAIIQRTDNLIDEKYKDEYGNSYVYRVEGLPRNYEGLDQEVLAVSTVGT